MNSDSNARGLLRVEASYSAQRLVDQAAADVRDPETGASVRDRALAALQVGALEPDATEDARRLAKAAADGGDFPIGAMGSGSDYTPFVQHLGVTSINLEYGGEGEQQGVYHSQYDTFEHFSRFGDPGMTYGVVLAETAGRIVLRTADADVVPLQFGDLVANVAENIDELHRLVPTLRQRRKPSTGCSTRTPLRWPPTPPGPAPRRHGKTTCQTSTWPRWMRRWPACAKARRTTTARWPRRARSRRSGRRGWTAC